MMNKEPDTTPLVVASRLCKRFGETVAVDDLSLQVAGGEIYGLVGSDGAGKTTTLRLLVGALKPDSGTAVICGFPLAGQPEQARTRLGYLSQRFSLYEDLTVLENIRFFAEVRGLPRGEWLPRCMELLAFVGLDGFKDRRAGQLSGGMKQKLGLATALVTRPQVLLLDEPTTGVDPVTRQDFWQLLIRVVAQEAVAVVISTPYMDEASRCQRVGFMHAGRIIAEGAPASLRAALTDRVVEVRGSPIRLLRQACAGLEHVEDVRAFGDRLHLRVAPGRAQAVIESLAEAIPAAGGTLADARPVPPTLEDVFISLAAGRER
ncbi:MAG: ABC transporter ATP-binding protein [Chloroflexota bacterium]